MSTVTRNEIKVRRAKGGLNSCSLRPPDIMMRVGLPVLLALLIVSGQARSESGGLQIELNKLEKREASCRTYFVFTNRTESQFSSLKLDLVMFDPEGVVAERIAVEAAPLAAGKTTLKVFDIDGLPCERISKVLLNEVLSCGDSNGQREDCIAAIEPAARGAVQFVK